MTLLPFHFLQNEDLKGDTATTKNGDKAREDNQIQDEQLKGDTELVNNTDTVNEDAKKMRNTVNNQLTVDLTTIDVGSDVPPGPNKQAGKLSPNCTQTQTKEEIEGYVKTHRNCPKKRNNDFLWN
jgi:hypothetical protein